jgi:putative (di)nucleoside polyphosphate hydrolase
MDKPYRPCVVAVIQNQAGWLLVGERADHAGAWQLPQGGIDEGETAQEALFRELKEEIGTDQLELVRTSAVKIRYDFPAEVQRERMKAFRGQEQDWFLLRFKPGCGPELDKADGEFRAVQWMQSRDLITGIITWKQDAYREGLKALDCWTGV